MSKSEEIDVYNKHIEQLEKMIEQQSEIISRYQSGKEIKELQKKIKELKKASQEKNETILKLNKEIDEKNKKLDNNKADLKDALMEPLHYGVIYISMEEIEIKFYIIENNEIIEKSKVFAIENFRGYFSFRRRIHFEKKEIYWDYWDADKMLKNIKENEIKEE